MSYGIKKRFEKKVNIFAEGIVNMVDRDTLENYLHKIYGGKPLTSEEIKTFNNLKRKFNMKYFMKDYKGFHIVYPTSTLKIKRVRK